VLKATSSIIIYLNESITR